MRSKLDSSFSISRLMRTASAYGEARDRRAGHTLLRRLADMHRLPPMAAQPEEEHAIGYQVLPRGVPVEAADGERVGTFHKAIHHPREHMLDGIVIETHDGR